MERRPQSAEQPASEPEIIPPERGGRRPPWGGGGGEGVQRVYVARVGPFSFLLLALAIAILTAVALVILLGAFLVALPLAFLLLAIALIAGIMRRRPR
jgi:hypothetical protein